MTPDVPSTVRTMLFVNRTGCLSEVVESPCIEGNTIVDHRWITARVLQVCNFNGKEDWCTCLCPSGGPGGSETEDGYDCICLFDGQGSETGLPMTSPNESAWI